MDEHRDGNELVSFRDLYAALTGLRDHVVANWRARGAELSAAITESEQRLSDRLDHLEATVNLHDDLIQQLRGARNLLTLVFGASVLTAVLKGMGVLHLADDHWEFRAVRPDPATWSAFRGLPSFATWTAAHGAADSFTVASRSGREAAA